ncbi:MAG TPA: hypothetical protein VFC58_16600 [Desulfosporosinus sp.]|nr:hypothetical protein [Desulfosporosinus sp.]
MGLIKRTCVTTLTSCFVGQTRAQAVDARGWDTRQIGRPCPVAGGTRPVFRPTDASTALAEFGSPLHQRGSLV